MTKIVVNSVSTRKVSKVAETLCGTSFSKSTVSELCKDLDVEMNKFRKRPLFYHPTLREMESNHEEMAKIAQEQQLSLIA